MSLSPPYYEDVFAEAGKMSRDLAPSSPDQSSPAQLSLRRFHEQTTSTGPKKDGPNAGNPVAGLPAKGKPRLLLMGQRR